MKTTSDMELPNKSKTTSDMELPDAFNIFLKMLAQILSSGFNISFEDLRTFKNLMALNSIGLLVSFIDDTTKNHEDKMAAYSYVVKLICYQLERLSLPTRPSKDCLVHAVNLVLSTNADTTREDCFFTYTRGSETIEISPFFKGTFWNNQIF